MSLFIGTLAFDTPEQAAQVRIGVLGGSLVSALIGYLVLRAAFGRAEATGNAETETNHGRA
jgi:NhaA family Na+:H+ antiporter